MKAVFINEHGGPEALIHRDRPERGFEGVAIRRRQTGKADPVRWSQQDHALDPVRGWPQTRIDLAGDGARINIAGMGGNDRLGRIRRDR